MTVKELLLHQLEYTLEKQGAYPPLLTALGGLTAQQAAWKPAPPRHSTWQIVRHLIHWDEAALDALSGRPSIYEELLRTDWHDVDEDDLAWEADVQRVRAIYTRLKARLEGMNEDDLAGTVVP